MHFCYSGQWECGPTGILTVSPVCGRGKGVAGRAVPDILWLLAGGGGWAPGSLHCCQSDLCKNTHLALSLTCSDSSSASSLLSGSVPHLAPRCPVARPWPHLSQGPCDLVLLGACNSLKAGPPVHMPLLMLFPLLEYLVNTAHHGHGGLKTTIY